MPIEEFHVFASIICYIKMSPSYFTISEHKITRMSRILSKLLDVSRRCLFFLSFLVRLIMYLNRQVSVDAFSEDAPHMNNNATETC